MVISRKWKIITGLNVFLLAIASLFFIHRYDEYNFAYYYFGEKVFNDQYWLHPHNKWVANVEYIKSGQGFIASAYIADEVMTIELFDEGLIEELKLDSQDAFFLSSEQPRPEKTTYGLFIKELEKNKILSYTCSGTTVNDLFCYYFLND